MNLCEIEDMTKKNLFFASLLLSSFLVACGSSSDVPANEPLPVDAPAASSLEASVESEKVLLTDSMKVQDIRIVMHTSKGQIEAVLFAQKSPLTVANFLNLAKRGYYDGLTFHRVVPNFMIQGGDPHGTGRGGPGYRFENEIHPMLSHNKPGIFSMANAGPNTNGSQFFITHTATTYLDGKHTVFGQVTEGQRVVDRIKKGAVIERIEVLDSTDLLFASKADRIAAWNTVLESNGY